MSISPADGSSGKVSIISGLLKICCSEPCVYLIKSLALYSAWTCVSFVLGLERMSGRLEDDPGGDTVSESRLPSSGMAPISPGREKFLSLLDNTPNCWLGQFISNSGLYTNTSVLEPAGVSFFHPPSEDVPLNPRDEAEDVARDTRLQTCLPRLLAALNIDTDLQT